MGDLIREPQVCEYLVDDLGVFGGRDEAHAAATARAGEHVDVEGAPRQVGPRPGAGSPGAWRVCITAGCAVVERTLRSGLPVRTLLRAVGVATLAAVASGIIVGGVGSCVAMRISALTTGPLCPGMVTENGRP